MSSVRIRRGLLVVAVLAAVASALPATATSTVKQVGYKGSRTISRTHLVNGVDVPVETKNFTVTVGQTTDLRGYQEIDVSWTGAHPTGGIIADPNSGDAQQEEYPVVLLQCRGVDSDTVPASQRLDPTTCWTATSNERFQGSFNTAFPPQRVDRYASATQRQAIVNGPQPRPAKCFTPAPAEYWVPFKAADGTVYAGGTNGCAGMAPEAANVGGLALPSNTTYAASNADGKGSTKFDIWTAEQNSSLGCSDTVACSLVAVPILGISCDVAAAALPAEDRPTPGAEADQSSALCQATGKFAPGKLAVPGTPYDRAVSGGLWWAASNWRNRVTVPLSFAPLSNVCDVLGNKAGVDIYGSELLTQATAQWAPRFCLDPKLFRFRHIQTAEPQARSLVKSGGAGAAFSSNVPDGGFGKPVVNAPVALTGFAISFSVDDGHGSRMTTLNLTPRLLAKLMTQSYPAINAMKQEYAPLANNPLNVSLDPEFIALNPDVPDGVPASQSASTLMSLSSDSDVIHALTSYIQADPEARAWLDGAPDPWGMVVNPNYEGIALPVYSWPLLDQFEPPLMYHSGTNPCLADDPVPYLPLVAAPLARLGMIAQQMQFSIANSTTVCYQVAEGISDGEKLIALGRQTPGFRFLIGVSALGDVARYGLVPASLQSQVAPGTPAKFTSASGRTFVAPDSDSLKAAADLLKPDATTDSWPVPYDVLRTDPAGAKAYPGTMVVYGQVPTTGLPAADAKDYAELLRFAVGKGQEPGTGNGQLPDGYLPLTDANGLGALSAYTLTAADAVAAQSGVVPPVVPQDETPSSDVVSPPPSSPYYSPSIYPSRGPNRSVASVTSPPSSDHVTAAAATQPAGSPGTTLAAVARAVAAFVPILLLVAAIAGAGALVLYLLERRRLRA